MHSLYNMGSCSRDLVQLPTVLILLWFIFGVQSGEPNSTKSTSFEGYNRSDGQSVTFTMTGDKLTLHSKPSPVLTLPDSPTDPVDNREYNSTGYDYWTESTPRNSSMPQNTTNGPASSEETRLNLAILPVLAGFFIITFVCIKCCNRVKADVVKDRDYIEDGKPLFRVEPDSHPDYLSSIGSGYNPYSTVTSGYNPYNTVTSGYNPYNTVTTMMSDVSAVSETKDAATMVKPRDLWKTMRHARGLSVPDHDELVRERAVLGDAMEEVKRLKGISSKSTKVMATKSSQASNRTQSCGVPKASPKPKQQPNQATNSKFVDSSDDDMLDSGRRQLSVVLAEVEHHRASPKPATCQEDEEERQALLRPEDGPDWEVPNAHYTEKLESIPITSNRSLLKKIEGENIVASSMNESTAKARPNSRSPGRPKNLSVSFDDGDSPSREKKIEKCLGKVQNVEINRKSLDAGQGTRRKFSLSKVGDSVEEKISVTDTSDGQMDPKSSGKKTTDTCEQDSGSNDSGLGDNKCPVSVDQGLVITRHTGDKRADRVSEKGRRLSDGPKKYSSENDLNLYKTPNLSGSDRILSNGVTPRSESLVFCH